MTQPVPADEIEAKVGARRHPIEHYGRVVTDEEQFYILHSAECRAAFDDLTGCPFSIARMTAARVPERTPTWIVLAIGFVLALPVLVVLLAVVAVRYWRLTLGPTLLGLLIVWALVAPNGGPS